MTGLHQGDFEVLEDGKPQPVATFEEHRAERQLHRSHCPPCRPTSTRISR